MRGPMSGAFKVKQVAVREIPATEEHEWDLFNIRDLIVVSDEMFDANERRAYNNDLEPCVLCGRGVREGSGWEVRGFGCRSEFLAVAEWEAFLNSSDAGCDMGIDKIGPECGKKFPAAYKRKEV